ncbi:hypothetical protein L1987_37223 [Smallanthus sonchifolius]|uniref:Uncharacterized protein n=1 Tax=Smallanthus sonchifolius TaxID=185202 RepID=A0ACB9HH46_9ASTR|nr:hypothetical protein L1987_37223 [Smallanthus sonchifolius]
MKLISWRFVLLSIADCSPHSESIIDLAAIPVVLFGSELYIGRLAMASMAFVDTLGVEMEDIFEEVMRIEIGSLMLGDLMSRVSILKKVGENLIKDERDEFLHDSYQNLGD